MKVLLLSPYPELLLPALEEAGDHFWCRDVGDEWPGNHDFIVSFGYRKIIKEPILTLYKDRIINIHIGFLPWNRGADPNFWSWFDGTPKGVTIHRIDEGIDTGNIIVQQQILKWQRSQTLSSSWDKLMVCAARLFADNWKNIRRDALPTRKADSDGTYHTKAGRLPHFEHLPLGWDTPVKDVVKLGMAHRASQHEKEDRRPRPRKYRQQAFKEL
jgi:methionyl-tRNA formyltransferase